MKNNLVAQLREGAGHFGDALYERAADEIERLTAELAALKIADCSNPYGCRRQASFDKWMADMTAERDRLREQVGLAMAEAQDVRERWIPECDRLRTALSDAMDFLDSNDDERLLDLLPKWRALARSA